MLYGFAKLALAPPAPPELPESSPILSDESLVLSRGSLLGVSIGAPTMREQIPRLIASRLALPPAVGGGCQRWGSY